MKLSACQKLKLGPLTGNWYRAIRQEHWKTRLSAKHTTTITTRYSSGSVENPSYQVLFNESAGSPSGLFTINLNARAFIRPGYPQGWTAYPCFQQGFGYWSVAQSAAVPEPTSIVLAGIACICGLAYHIARKRRANCAHPAGV